MGRVNAQRAAQFQKRRVVARVGVGDRKTAVDGLPLDQSGELADGGAGARAPYPRWSPRAAAPERWVERQDRAQRAGRARQAPALDQVFERIQSRIDAKAGLDPFAGLRRISRADRPSSRRRAASLARIRCPIVAEPLSTM
jgi:hypothetical protein